MTHDPWLTKTLSRSPLSTITPFYERAFPFSPPNRGPTRLSPSLSLALGSALPLLKSFLSYHYHFVSLSLSLLYQYGHEFYENYESISMSDEAIGTQAECSGRDK